MTRKGKLTTDLVAVKSNALVQAHYRLSPTEQTLVGLALTQLKPLAGPKGDAELPAITFTLKQVTEALGIDYGDRYETVFRAVVDLHSRVLNIIQPDGKTLVSNWMSPTVIDREGGTVVFQFHEKLKPYLIGLQKLYTPVLFRAVAQMKSSYSPRIYELLKQFQGYENAQGEWSREFTIVEIRAFLIIPAKQYKQFGHLSSKVISPAVEEVNAYSDIRILETVYVKTGRKVTGLRFVVTRQAPASSRSHAKTAPDAFIRETMTSDDRLLMGKLKKCSKEIQKAFDDLVDENMKAGPTLGFETLDSETLREMAVHDALREFKETITEGSKARPRTRKPTA